MSFWNIWNKSEEAKKEVMLVAGDHAFWQAVVAGVLVFKGAGGAQGGVAGQQVECSVPAAAYG